VRKRVCHMTTAHSVCDERIFHKECKALLKAGYEVSIIARHEKDDLIQGIRVIALPEPTGRIHRMFGTTLRALSAALGEKADIYHFHDPEIIPAALVLRLLGKKVIYDIHEDYGKQILSKQYIRKKVRRPVARSFSLFEQAASRFFDSLITATDDILKNFPRHKYAFSIKNYPVLSDFHAIKSKEAARNSFRLIYAGGLSELRGITSIVRSLELLGDETDVTLTLCGEFYPPGYREALEKEPGYRNVKYLGFRSPRDIPVLLSEADAGMVCLLPAPNHMKGMPVKLFEYMAAGLPVIASGFELWREIVEGNKCGICVNPESPEEIAAAIRKLVRNPGLREEMGKNGRKAVREKYNWESEKEKLLFIYKGLISAPALKPCESKT